jgi:TfoX/Sxy family transcriptional regulator of competence genes
MASKQITVDFILKQIADAGIVSAKKMFGEYGIYCDGKIVALVCDDQLFVKPTLAGETYLGNYTEGFPYPGAKPWFLIPSEKWKESPWLSQLIKLSAAQLAQPKPKKKKLT